MKQSLSSDMIYQVSCETFCFFFFFFFNDTATTEIYTLSLHDALPIGRVVVPVLALQVPQHLPGLLPTVGEVLAVTTSPDSANRRISRRTLFRREWSGS